MAKKRETSTKYGFSGSRGWKASCRKWGRREERGERIEYWEGMEKGITFLKRLNYPSLFVMCQ